MVVGWPAARKFPGFDGKVTTLYTRPRATASSFLTEALLLSALGGAGGVALGALVTIAFAASRGWPAAIPIWVQAGGISATLVIGMIAGLYPAVRAARLAPTEALSAP